MSCSDDSWLVTSLSRQCSFDFLTSCPLIRLFFLTRYATCRRDLGSVWQYHAIGVSRQIPRHPYLLNMRGERVIPSHSLSAAEDFSLSLI